MSCKSGKVIIPASIAPWDHELKTAHALARHGFTVEFVAVSNNHKAKTADAIIDSRRMSTYFDIMSLLKPSTEQYVPTARLMCLVKTLTKSPIFTRHSALK